MMKNFRWPPIVWVILLAISLTAFISVVEQGRFYLGKNYLDTIDFKEDLDLFYENIGPVVLNPPDPEEMKKRIVVTKSEIEEHRTRYGSLTDQITNIQEQYEYQIEEAEAISNEELTAVLIKERDKKIADIQKNFEDGEYIEEKIRAEKSEVIDLYMENLPNSQLWTSPFIYEFTDVKTGEKYSNGNIDVPTAYEKEFNGNVGLFHAGSISSYGLYGGEVQEVTGLGHFYRGPHMDEVAVDRYQTNSDIENVVGNTFKLFEGKVILSKQALRVGSLGERVSNYNREKYIHYTLWIIGVITLTLLLTKIRFKKEWFMGNVLVDYNKLKIDVKFGLILFSVYLTVLSAYINAEQYGYNSLTSISMWIERIFVFGILAIILALTVFQLVNFVEQLKNKEITKRDIAESYTSKVWSALQELFLEKSIGVQTIILLSGVFFAGIGFVSVFIEPSLLVIYIPAVFFAALPVLYILLRRSAYLNRIIATTEAMAQGRLHEEIRVEGKSPLAKHAANLNNLREGVRISMNEQAKSERLKTELITNVSHDLRTPLTSIITYTDLLKSEDLSNEDRIKYVDILDKKSQRLKTLIEDLFEVSKMTSGNLELNKQRVDLTQLLQQALAEHEEEILTSKLDFRLNIPEVGIIANVDGQRWWRVLDNLIVNAIKYSMPGTRVYITLKQVDDVAQFELKNISKYELNENGDELFERFKRADTSRHTDGSGLGLAIAQSIVDMHEGEMKIEVDGDLFKVTVKIPVV